MFKLDCSILKLLLCQNWENIFICCEITNSYDSILFIRKNVFIPILFIATLLCCRSTGTCIT
jgi:hypothetical protein